MRNALFGPRRSFRDNGILSVPIRKFQELHVGSPPKRQKPLPNGTALLAVPSDMEIDDAAPQASTSASSNDELTTASELEQKLLDDQLQKERYVIKVILNSEALKIP